MLLGDHTHLVPTFDTSAGFASKTGRRMTNDDYAAVEGNPLVFAVADGIGGAPRGDVMSRVACGAAIDAIKSGADPASAIIAADVEVRRIKRWFDIEGSGSTLILAQLADDKLELAWVGDSAAYILRDKALTLVSRIDRIPGTNALASAVGGGIDTCGGAAVRVQVGDRLLLCTDGVWSALSRKCIAARLSENASMPYIAESLVSDAIEKGDDNATAAVVSFERVVAYG